MRTRLTTLLTVIGAVTVLVLVANTIALAATGKAILAGRSNTAANATGITRTTSGTALVVKTKSTANSPFAVNGRGKVVNLDADKVDGINGGESRAYGWSFSGYRPGETEFFLNGLPSGKYLINYEFVLAPSQIADGATADCYVVFSAVERYGYVAETAEVKNAFGIALSGTGRLTVRSGDAISLICRTSPQADWTIDTHSPVRVTAIPIGLFVNKGNPLG